MNRINDLHNFAAEAEVNKVAKEYCRTSPRVHFGEGGIPMLQRLMTLDSVISRYEKVDDPENIVAGGWIALEIASHFPGSPERTNFIDKATSRFSQIDSLRDSTNKHEKLNSYSAGLGLIAVNAYSTDLLKASEDSPGLYTEMIESLCSDELMKSDMFPERWGLMGELTVGAVCGSLDLLTLPASIRHDKPLSTERPSFAHDLQVWDTLPDTLPQRPNHYLQVKTGINNYKSKIYSEAIRIFNTTHYFEDSLHQVAKMMIKLYSGEHLGYGGENIIRRSQQAIKKSLAETLGNDAYQLRGYRMRGGGRRRK